MKTFAREAAVFWGMFLFVLDPGLIGYEFLSSASVLKLISLIKKKKYLDGGVQLCQDTS